MLHKFSNICKPEEGWYRQPKYCYEKTTHVVLNQLCSSLWTSRFWFLIFWLIRSLQEIQRLQLAGSSSTVFKVNSIPLLYPMSLSKFNLNKMADAASSEASVPAEPEAVRTAEPSRESTVASLSDKLRSPAPSDYQFISLWSRYL